MPDLTKRQFAGPEPKPGEGLDQRYTNTREKNIQNGRKNDSCKSDCFCSEVGTVLFCSKFVVEVYCGLAGMAGLPGMGGGGPGLGR